MPNVNIQGTLYPAITDEPTHDSYWGKGGWRTAQDQTDRDSTPAERKINGMVVHQLSNGKTYMLSGGNWVENAFIDDNSLNGSKILNLSIATAKIADLAIDASKIADFTITNGKIATYTIANNNLANGAAITIISPTSAFDGNAPTSDTGLVLKTASDIDFNDAELFVTLRVTTYDTSASFFFGPSGEVYDAGISTITLGAGQKGLISTTTGPSGQMEWRASSAVSASLDVISYIR